MSSTTEPNGTTPKQAGSDLYAMTLVVSAETADQAYDFVTDLLDKPHPWEGPCAAAFVGTPTEVDYQEEYDSAGVATKILDADREALADQALTASVLDAAEGREAEADLREQLGDGADCEQFVRRDDMPEDGGHQ